MLYNDNTYKESNKNLLYAIEVLEKAHTQKDKNVVVVDNKRDGFWNKVGDFLNPFKCGKDQ